MRAGKGFVMEPIATIRRDSVTSRMKPHHLTSDAEVERVAHRRRRGLHWTRASKSDGEGAHRHHPPRLGDEPHEAASSHERCRGGARGAPSAPRSALDAREQERRRVGEPYHLNLGDSPQIEVRHGGALLRVFTLSNLTASSVRETEDLAPSCHQIDGDARRGGLVELLLGFRVTEGPGAPGAGVVEVRVDGGVIVAGEERLTELIGQNGGVDEPRVQQLERAQARRVPVSSRSVSMAV